MEFADRIDSILGMYSPEVTRAQLNLLDSHDTPRFLTCAGEDLNSLKLALTFIFSYPGAPCIFYGDEIGLTGRHDPDCRKSFVWDERKWNKGLRDFVKELISVRNSNKALRWGNYTRLYSEDKVYAFGRSLDGEQIAVALNSSEAARTIHLDNVNLMHGTGRILFGRAEFHTERSPLQLTIPPRSGVIWKYVR